MAEDGPSTGSGGSGRPPSIGKRLNGHASPETVAKGEAKEGVVVPFPKRKKAWPAWLSGLLGWIALVAFAGLVWGISKDGRVDAVDVFAGLAGVLAALWFYRTR